MNNMPLGLLIAASFETIGLSLKSCCSMRDMDYFSGYYEPLICFYVSALEGTSSSYAADLVPRESSLRISRCLCLVHTFKRFFQVSFCYTNVFDQT